jgi:hypothetical protein
MFELWYGPLKALLQNYKVGYSFMGLWIVWMHFTHNIGSIHMQKNVSINIWRS